jgi:hypothetical protein
MQMTTAGQLEAWFLSSHLNPAPTSAVAAVMRSLLEKHPDLSFDELRELARERSKVQEGGELNGGGEQSRRTKL